MSAHSDAAPPCLSPPPRIPPCLSPPPRVPPRARKATCSRPVVVEIIAHVVGVYGALSIQVLVDTGIIVLIRLRRPVPQSLKSQRLSILLYEIYHMQYF